jgi:hypothetical protein
LFFCLIRANSSSRRVNTNDQVSGSGDDCAQPMNTGMPSGPGATTGQVPPRAANVLFFTAPSLSNAEVELHDQALSLLEAAPGLNVLSVKLPRAESMLLPRIVGLWDVLVFFGGSGSVAAPTAERVVAEAKALHEGPIRLVLACHPGDLWPGWRDFQTHLYRSAADERMIDPDDPDALANLLSAVGVSGVGVSRVGVGTTATPSAK